jgi:hypothetical protein
MILPASPDLIEEFDLSYSISSWVLTPLKACAVMTPIAGNCPTSMVG